MTNRTDTCLIKWGNPIVGYRAEEKLIFVEASELGLPPGEVPRSIVFQGKQHIVVYHQQFIHRDNEGDIQYWDYAPTERAQRITPECTGTRIRIWND
jgi:hypothetical protein